MIDQKPPLSGVYLAHVGVKGMKWGQRKAALSNAVKSRLPEGLTKKRVKAVALAGSVAVGSILYATGKLKPTASYVGGRTVHGSAWIANKTVEGAITGIGTPINFLTNNKYMPFPTV